MPARQDGEQRGGEDHVAQEGGLDDKSGRERSAVER